MQSNRRQSAAANGRLSRRLLRFAIVVAASLGGGALLAAGCGEQETLSRAEYETKMREINQAAYDRLDELAATHEPPDADRLDDIRDELDDTADELADLAPPEEIAATHDRWVDGLRSAADTIGDIEDDLTSDDRTVQLKGYQKLGESLAATEIEKARREFVAKGYDIFGAPDTGAAPNRS